MNSNFQDALKAIEDAQIIAFDTETTGLNVRKASCLGLGIAVSESLGFYFTNPYMIKGVLNKLRHKKLLAWNAYFDLEIVRNNFDVDLWHELHADVLCLKHTVDENQPFDLKGVGAKIFGESAKTEQAEVKASIKANGGAAHDYSACDPEILGKYCIKDCLLTYKLFNYYEKQLKAEALTSFFYKKEVMPLYKEVTRFMQSRGVKVDVPLLEKTQKEITEDIDKLEKAIISEIEPILGEFNNWYANKEYPIKASGPFAQECVRLSGCDVNKTAGGKFSLAKGALKEFEGNDYIDFLLGNKGLSDGRIRHIQRNLLGDSMCFNLLSKHHLKKVFFTTLKEKPLSTTEKGNPQVNDDFIQLMAEKYNWCNLLGDFNKLHKLKSSYIDRILELQEDGIFYPQFHQHRTVSGRYGSDFQQLNRPKEEGELRPTVLKYNNIVRKFFISRDNRVFIDSDYESLEPHVFSHVSGEKSIQDIFHNNHDFYSTIAINTENLKDVSADKSADNYLGKVNKKKRQDAKVYSLGIPYGMEGYALSKNLNIEQKEGERLVKKYLDGFPDLANWMRVSNDDMVNKGFVTSEAGRKRRFSMERGLYWRYGKDIICALKTWEKYHEDEKGYETAKWARKRVKNALNNAKNFKIQSLSASIVNRATIAINRELRNLGIDGYVIAQIHDQIVVEVPLENAEECRELVQNIMENIYKLDVKLKAPASIAKDLYEGH